MKSVTPTRGRINRSREMPEDLIATSSKLSPRFPKVINEERSTARGSASGINTALWYQMNRRMVNASSPLPTKSSIQSQKNCITNTKRVMKKVATNGPTKAFMISLSNFFNCFRFLVHGLSPVVNSSAPSWCTVYCLFNHNSFNLQIT